MGSPTPLRKGLTSHDSQKDTWTSQALFFDLAR
jgi:hypothetical protein